jgi:hypothetical protein
MKKTLFFVAGCIVLIACNNKAADTTAAKTDSSTTTTSEPKPTPPSEIADAKYIDMGRQMLVDLSKGDVDGFTKDFADDAKWRWSSGDSLTGKAAILAYWKNRRTNVIDSINFINDIWLPLKVNTPQRGPDAKGIWLIGWYMTNVKYKNGKKLIFWVHHDFHLNDAGKIDQTVQYLDRAPINAALGVK